MLAPWRVVCLLHEHCAPAGRSFHPPQGSLAVTSRLALTVVLSSLVLSTVVAASDKGSPLLDIEAMTFVAAQGGEVEVFGRRVTPGQLIHADKHGFLAVPPGEETGLLEAAVFMDQNECNTVIKAARGSAGVSREELLGKLNLAESEIGEAAR